MENQDTYLEETKQSRLLELDYACDMLSTTAKWARFLGIMGFIASGFMVMAGLTLVALGDSVPIGDDNLLNSVGNRTLGVIYTIVATLYFFPSRYLYQYAEKLNAAVQSKDETQLILALDKNKSFFKFVGIMMGAVLAFYLLAFVSALLVQMNGGSVVA